MNSFETIWRVENMRGCGPYRKEKFGGLITELSDLGFNDYQDPIRPDPTEDPGLAPIFNALKKKEQKKWIYGFKTLAQYRWWFNTKEVRELLDESGFFLTCYKVPYGKAIQGLHQSMFIRSGSTVVAFRNCLGKPISCQSQEKLDTPMLTLLEKKNLSYSPN